MTTTKAEEFLTLLPTRRLGAVAGHYKRVLKLFGRRGQHWTQRTYEHHGNYCMLGASYAVNGVGETPAIMLLNKYLQTGVISFNDRQCRVFTDIKDVYDKLIKLVKNEKKRRSKEK